LRPPEPTGRLDTDGTRQVIWDGTIRSRYERSLAWFDHYLKH
jgi:hypothetical protein